VRALFVPETNAETWESPVPGEGHSYVVDFACKIGKIVIPDITVVVRLHG